MIRGVNLKLIAICLMGIFIFQIAFPTVSFALTGGPSQPEVSSFEPIGTTQMVDLYTGDFNYNIPLLNVPGSNGSYPINIAYNAGVGMEQEASWVGLGWNINPGAIVRQMRGIPDDFNGDQVQKEFSIRTDWTLGLSASVKAEVLGATIKNLLGAKTNVGFNMYYNSYRGVGYRMGHNFSNIFNGKKSDKEKKNPITANLGLNFDSQGGLSVQPSISFNRVKKDREQSFSVGPSITSTQGIREMRGNISSAAEIKDDKDNGTGEYDRVNAIGAGMSLSNPGYIPGIQNPMFSTSFSGSLDLGPAAQGAFAGSSFRVNYSETRVTQKNRTANAYGLMYQEGAEGDEEAIMDFNREKDGEISKESPYTPVPVRTNDIYSIQGQGIGGAFRAFRSDIGQLKDQKNVSHGVTGSLALEAGSGAGLELGADPVLGYSNSYSGPWKTTNHSISQLNRYKSTSNSTSTPNYENFYFKSNGEQTSSTLHEMARVGYDKPVAFDLGLHVEGINIKPKVKNSLGGGRVGYHNQSERTKRNQSIEYFTKKELANSPVSSRGKDHHIHKIEVRNPDGNLYSYGLPVYNTIQKDVSFSVQAPSDANTEDKAYTYNDKLVTYQPNQDNTANNDKGEDNYFSSTTLPEYSHAHMLTEIKSADYVDITGNGVTNDDFGFWTKFEYTSVADYHWRFPYEQNKANYSRGYYSNTKDDKGSYSYGKKDLQYLTKVETNTHIAIFQLEDREDGVSVAGENGGRGTVKQKLLKRISLYSKKDTTKPIKEVHFVYDYSLCPGIPSSINNGGKLTLKKIYFTHLENNKGSLSPYEFTYGNNESYQQLESDRWGNYQSHASGGHQNYVDNPYTRQDSYGTRNSDISAWNLVEIQLPSGGKINVDYESDDYLYVQNKQAHQMYEIVGFSKTDVVASSLTNMNKLSKKERRVYFRTYKSSLTNSEVHSYIKGIKDLYFKAFLNLKNGDNGEQFKDYVTGYAPIDTEGGYGSTTIGGEAYGYFNLKTVNYKGKTGSGFQANPIQMAGWRYMRYQRPDIFNTYGKGFNVIKNSVKRLVGDVGSIIAGYYNKAKVAGHCGTADLTAKPKSYVRLNSVGKKYGGGHRVKEIRISSGWGANEIYGQEYSYVQEDGVTSSGVAEYEPMTGGDEISLRQPNYFHKKRNLLFKHQDFKEEPYGESYFPGAKVGYSRVVVRNLKKASVTKAQTGVSVNEFFTSVDYPVIVKKANETVLRKGFNLTLPIPLIGNQSFNNNGYSNGYTIKVNDMPGKPKSVATYPYSASNGKFTGNPVSATYYTYQDKWTTDKDGQAIKELDNQVKVLDAHGQTRYAKIGESYDFFIDQAEHSSFSIDLGLQVNANLVGLIPVPSLFPSIESSQSSYRHVITNKVIFRNGVLKSVENITDGASVIATNEMYDAETGQVLLTSSDNEHQKPIYNYTYPAHWAYDRMGGAYENYRVQLALAGGTSGVYSLSPSSLKVTDYIKLGDKIVAKNNFNTAGWVTDINPTANTFTIKDKYNQTTLTSLSDVLIIESGNSNMQSISNGNIVSFENPVYLRNQNLSTVDLIKTALSQLNANGKTTGTITKVDSTDIYGFCSIKEIEFNSTSGPNASISLKLVGDQKECLFSESHPYGDNTLGKLIFDLATIKVISSTQIEFKALNTKDNQIYTFNLNYTGDQECEVCDPQPILQASAIEFSEDWSYNYEDIGAPENETGDLIENHTTTYSPDLNPYYYGQKGVWRTLRSWAYQENRKQHGSKGNKTRIDVDGQFDFVPFDWKVGNTGNDNWTWASEITLYSPYGYQLENKNALDIYSSEMYGYENTVVTAVGSNAKYMEIAYDGFEDYPYNGTINSYPSYTGAVSHGHFNFPSNLVVTSKVAHTGNNSIEVEEDGGFTTFTGGNSNYFTPLPNKKYVLSAWVYTKGVPDTKEGFIEVKVNSTTHTAQVTDKFKEIDGWTKIEVEFSTPSSITTFQIKLSSHATGPVTNFDDLRISPFNGGMKTYVYNPTTLWLVAELDNLNYATFYNYDEEGSLTQIKKETPRGIATIKQSRNNTQR